MDSILKILIRQDSQDYLDFLYGRFPDETGHKQFASRKYSWPIPGSVLDNKW
jgi:hypothetical protein